MSFIIPGSTQDAAAVIIAAVQRFPVRYHRHFALVRSLAVTWLENPCAATAAPLARALQTVLPHWGAGKRLAASVQPFATLVQNLTSPAFIAALTKLRTTEGRLDRDQVAAALQFANVGIVTSETTFLYSQKSLMLIAGIGPALDSQVRIGLKNLHLAGFSSPYVASRVLPVLMAADDWTRDQSDAIALAATQNATVAQIVGLRSPARLMDILLFVGGHGLRWGDGLSTAA